MMKDLLQGVTLQDLQDESSDEESVEVPPFSPFSSVCDESLREIEVSDSHSLNEFDLQYSSSPTSSTLIHHPFSSPPTSIQHPPCTPAPGAFSASTPTVVPSPSPVLA